MPKKPSETAAIQGLVDKMKQQGHQRAPLAIRLNPLASTAHQISAEEMLARVDAKSSETLADLNAPTDTKRVERIACSLIDDSPYQPRLVYDQDVIEAYAESIDKNGQLDPIKLRKKANGRYEQLDGHIRIRSIRDVLGNEYLDAIIHDVDDATARAYVMAYTTAKTGVSSFELALMYQAAIDAGETPSEIAKSNAVSRAHISQCLIFTKLPERFQDVLKKSPRLMSYRAAGALVDLIAETPDQEDLIFTGFKESADKRIEALTRAKDSAKESSAVKAENYEVSAASLRSWLHKHQNTTVKAAKKPPSRFITDTKGSNVIELKNGAKPGEIVIRCLAAEQVSSADIEEAIFELLRTKFTATAGAND